MASPPVEIAEWGPTRPHPMSAIAWLWLAVVLGVPAAVIGLVALLLAGPAVAAAAVLLVWVALALWILMQGKLALSSCKAVRLPPGSDHRLEELVAGVASDLGMEAPEIWTAALGGANAMVCRSGGTALVIGDETVSTLTRTELEAVLTHSLLRAQRGELWRGALATALGPAAGPAAPHVGPLEDSMAAAMTRYPPALVSALERCHPVPGRFSVLWFSGRGPYHASAESRIAALSDL